MKLSVKDLSVTLSGRRIVQGISFEVRDHDLIMIVGANGAGKSTVIRAVSGAIPSSGSILLDGTDVRTMRPAERARRIAVMDPIARIPFSFTAWQLVSMGRYVHRRSFLHSADPGGDEKIADAISRVRMLDKKDQSVDTMSSGERQRVLLAQALCQEPDLLILDEPGSHLDLTYTREMYDLINDWRMRDGHAVIAVVHDLSAAKYYGTRTLLLRSGTQIGFGPCADVLTDEAVNRAWQTDVTGWLRQMSSVWK